MAATRIPARRLVLLGASNVAISLPVAVNVARDCWGSGLEIVAACGHGRAYGVSSSVLGRRLPGILGCEIWKYLRNRTPLPCHAVITDVGNDLIYGARLSTIVCWVEKCLDRLLAAGATVTVASLPLESLQRLSPLRFQLFRRLLFPSHPLPFGETLKRATELNRQLVQLTYARGATLVEQPGCWFGLDPIHIRRRSWNEAWQLLLDHAPPRDSPWDTFAQRFWQPLYLRSLRPQRYHLFGFARGREQPCGQLADGTTVAMF